MINYIVIVVATLVVFLLVFSAFVADDSENDAGYLADDLDNDKPEKEEEKKEEKIEATEPLSIAQYPSQPEVKEVVQESVEPEHQSNVVAFDDSSSMFQQLSDEEELKQASKPAEITRIHPVKTVEPNIPLLEVGSEDDLRLRLEMKQNLAKPVSIEKSKSVAAVVQLRFPDEVMRNSGNFVEILSHAEQVFEKEFSFPFNTFQSTQFNRIWIFEPAEDRDTVIEALIDAYEVTIRFRKALESDKLLKENRIRIAVGISAGDMTFISRGVNSEPSLVGMPIYMAETLAEIVGDFGIYVDSNIHNATIPLFDFREWKPTVVRTTLPPIPLYELVGWNKPDEIATYVKHEEASARRAVAVAYRYFELEDTHPLIELLTDKDKNVAYEAINTISFIGSEKMNGVLKIRLREATDSDIKSKIIEAFGNAGNPSLLPVVLGSTKESSWKVRLAATKALYQLGGGEALGHLEAMLKDPDSIVRVVANSIFFKETNKPEYFNLLVEGLNDASKRARATAVDCLMAIGSDRALKEITNSFANQEMDLQKHILSKMLDSKSKILYQCFLTMFKNSSEALRPHVVEAVRRAGIVS